MESSQNVEIARDVRQSDEYGKYMERIGWKVIKIQDIQIFVKGLGPVAVAKIQRVDLPLAWDRIEKALRKNRVMMCILEPNFLVSVGLPGFGLNKWPYLPTKTLRIGLRSTEDKIFAQFTKRTRYTLRKLSNYDLGVSINDYDEFYEIWKNSAKRKNLWISSKKDFLTLVESFGKKCFCATLRRQGYGGQAGALILIHDKTAYYYYAGATKEGNTLNLPYWVVWEAMKEAKKRGVEVWDFEGIYDERWPTKSWMGFSQFKKSFGGVEIEYPGSFVKWRWPWS